MFWYYETDLFVKEKRTGKMMIADQNSLFPSGISEGNNEKLSYPDRMLFTLLSYP